MVFAMGVIYEYHVTKNGSKRWPFRITSYAFIDNSIVSWHVPETFNHATKIEQWLTDSGMEFKSEQTGFSLVWEFKDRGSATMFMLRWNDET